MFFVNYLDRVAISFAGPSGMNRDLGLDAAQFGFAASVFFVGYLLVEIPSNLALHRYGARRWLARIMVSWGLVTVLTAFVTGALGLYVLRFLLGVAEAGFFPGAILFLSLWVPRRYRAQVLGSFYVAQPLTFVVGAPLASALMELHAPAGLAGWRFMYLGVGVLAVLTGVATFLLLPDRPAEARWLSPAQRRWIADEIAREADDGMARHAGALEALRSGRVWLFAVVYFGIIYGLYTLSFFLPTIIAGFEGSTGKHLDVMGRGLVTAIPYVPAALVLFFWSRDASRRGARGWHVGIPTLAGAAAVPLALLMPSPAAQIALITVLACAVFGALPTFWSFPPRFLSGRAAASGIALINTVGNIAGLTGPWLTGWLKVATGGYEASMCIVGGFMALSGLVVFALARGHRPPSRPAAGSA
ncbi:MAG: MFS transporter [Gluconacetobacter diazotrophicus]|nr:MFS transporter [Gluconacetobacter diazotrophicus]